MGHPQLGGGYSQALTVRRGLPPGTLKVGPPATVQGNCALDNAFALIEGHPQLGGVRTFQGWATGQRKTPQWLKPSSIVVPIGTAKVVPFPKPEKLPRNG